MLWWEKIWQGILEARDFAVSYVNNACVPVLLRVIRTHLDSKEFKVIQNNEISDWTGIKSLLESAFSAKRMPGYLQLELNSNRQ